MHGLRRVRPRVSDGRHPIDNGWCGPEDRHLVVRRLHSVPSVRDRMSGAGRQRLARCRGGRLHSRAAGAQRIVRYRSGHGTWHVRASGSAPGPHLHESADRLRDRIRGRLGRSLHVRQVDAGSCNACEMEIAATTNPLYDLERFGVHLVASPRHADRAARHRSRDTEHGDRAAKDL